VIGRYATGLGILGVTDKELHWQLIDSETREVGERLAMPWIENAVRTVALRLMVAH
jgi:hypothetical protein